MCYYIIMNTVTIPKKIYRNILERQKTFETELRVVKKMLQVATEDSLIQPTVLKHWESISQDLDMGKGRKFVSVKEMKHWLKRL